MRSITGLVMALCGVASSAVMAQPPCPYDNIGNGSIGVFADAAGTNNCLLAASFVPTTWYVIATLAGGSSAGLVGAEFRIEIENPTGYFFSFSPNPSAGLTIGSPINSSPPAPGLEFGMNITFHACQAPNNGKVLLGTIQALNVSAQGSTSIAVMARTPPTLINYDCPLLTLCDAPAFTKLGLTQTADVIGRDGVTGSAFVNRPGCVPCDPAGVPIGIFANTAGIPGTLCTQRQVPSLFHLLARVPAFNPPGINSIQFRIEVSHPGGYFFNYVPPLGIQAIGSPVNITPPGNNGPAGVTLLFPECTTGDSLNGLLDIGTLSVLDLAGGPTQVAIRGATSPESGSPGCPRFFRCDPPFNTPVCIAPSSPSGAAFEAGLNIEECTQTPFTTETALLDTRESSNDGAAGPVSTTQPLYAPRMFLITVEGTASLTDAASWNSPPAILCGAPERTPQRASSGVTNYWVGVDPEIQFAAVLPLGSDCADLALLGYPRHHARLQVDLGNGFEHIEPLGPVPADPSPGHKYQYLVRGTGAPARFQWVEPQTADNYGVLRITIDDVSPTDATAATPAPASAAARRVVVLPNSPDPFNPTTEIRWWLGSRDICRVAVFDARGILVRRLLEGGQSAGLHSVRWDGRCDDGSRAATGVYFAQVSSQTESASERMILVK